MPHPTFDRPFKERLPRLSVIRDGIISLMIITSTFPKETTLEKIPQV